MRTAIVIFAFILLSGFPCAQADQGAEISIKAAFLYKFCGYTLWPDSSFAHENSPILVGVVGDSALYEKFESILKDQRLGSRSVDVRKINTAEDINGIHVLYIANEARLTAAETTLLKQKAPILTITESTNLADLSVIQFSIQNDRVRFEVSKTRAEEIGLRLSSQLLSVAIRVN